MSLNKMSEKELEEAIAELDSLEERFRGPKTTKYLAALKETLGKKKAAAAFEAKVGKGNAPQEASPADVISRLEKMGIGTDQMEDAVGAYENVFDAYKRHKDLTLDEFKDDLKIRDYPKNKIERMLKYVDLIDPIVKADLGYSSPDQVFPDAVSRRNYLIANHFSPEEIAKIDAIKPDHHSSAFTMTADGKMVNAPGYDLPEDAKKRIVLQYAKQARAGVKRSKEEEDKDFAIHEKQKHTAQSVTGQISDETADQLRQTAANLAVKWYNDGHPEYKGDNWAETTEEEKEAEKILKSLAPGDSRREELERLKADAMKNRLSSDAAAPYMEKASRGLDEDYESRFAGKQEKDEQNLLDKMNKNYLEKIAPTIRQNYLTNNVTGHSRINEDMADTYKKLQEDNLKTVAANRIQNQMQHLKLLAEEKQKDAGLAVQAGDLAQKDLQTKLSAIGASEALNKTGENEHLGHMDRLGSLGEKKKSQTQAELDLKKQDFLDKADHIRKSAGFMSDVASGNFLYGVHEQTPSRFPKRNPGNWKSSTSRGILNAGLRSEEKEGGRVHLAEGGEIDPQQAIDSAVTQGTTPSYEIGRMNNKYVTNAAGIGYLKARNAQKQAYAIGGNVNPIMEGASQAQAVADEDKRQKLEEDAARQRYDKIREDMMRAPAEKEVSPLRKFINNFMEGAATGEGNDWVSRAGQAYVATEKSEAEKAKAKSESKGKHNDLVSKLMAQHQAEMNKRASQKLAERKQGESELTGKSMREYYAQHGNLFDAQAKKLNDGYNMEGIPPEDQPTKKQTKEDQTALDKIGKARTGLEAYANQLNALSDTAIKLKSGEYTGKLNNWVGPTITSMVTPATRKDLSNLASQKTTTTNAKMHFQKLWGDALPRLAVSANTEVHAVPDEGKEPEENARLSIVDYTLAINDTKEMLAQQKRHGASLNEQAQTQALLDRLEKEKADKILQIEKNKPISHNVDYATGSSNQTNSNNVQKAAQDALAKRGVYK